MPELFAGACVPADRVPRLLCVVGIPRTGTNYLCSVLNRFSGIEGRFEIFHPNRSYSMHPVELLELSRLLGKRFVASPEDPEAVRTIRSHPELALECILRLMPPSKRLLTFKVFSHHLTAAQVTEAIVARPDAMIVFVRRRPVEAYISHQKALALGKWSQIDTTDLEIRISAENFLQWWQQAADWYLSLEAACWAYGKRFNRLSYERDIDIAPAHLVQRLKALLASNGIHDLAVPDGDLSTEVSRQDRTEDVERRVVNWVEFCDQLSATGAEHKAFDPMPQFQAEPGT